MPEKPVLSHQITAQEVQQVSFVDLFACKIVTFDNWKDLVLKMRIN